MMITNFSAGELSETLFGRIDIPQYFNGVSRLENFDVIPTGGIKRRGGTVNLSVMDEEGRVIPFIVNRSVSFLLYLTQEKITVYKIEKRRLMGEPVVFENNNNLRIYEKLDEINEVQYAQNYDTMILCHENYPPLEVKFNNLEINISILRLSFDKYITKGERVTDNDSYLYKKDDEIYSSGWLITEEHYPSTASFFNGRLVFANTKNEHQRLFFSSIKKENEDYNFSTNKIFLTEKREYITIFGSVDPDVQEKNIILIENNEGIKFQKALEDYYFDTPFFSKDTRIEKLQGNVLKTSKSALITLPITQDVIDVLNHMETKSENLDKFPSTSIEYLVATLKSTVLILNTPNITTINYYITVGATQIKFRVDELGQNTWPFDREIIHKLDKKAVLLYEENPQYFYNFIMSFIPTELFEGELKQNNINIVTDLLKSNSLETMKYHLESGYINETFYNYGPEIKNIVKRRHENAQNIYIPLYTREIISDEYPTPDCGFTFEIASDMNDAIQWLAVNKGLIIGTETSEWIIPPGIHANNVQATLNSRYGSDNIQGTAIGDATCFLQTGKKGLVEYYIPQQDNNFRANNMAMLSDNMLRESPAKEFDFISSPYTKLFITREDGIAVTLLYERGTGTFAWSRFTTKGEIKSAAALPGFDGYDELYLLVKRGNNFNLEILCENSNIYLDGYKQWDGNFSEYTDDAVIYDEENKKTYTFPKNFEGIDITLLPQPSEKIFIGYPYKSIVRSMPILANDKMKPNNIKNILFRFLGSYMPKIKSLPNNVVNTIPCEEPYSGVWKTTFPGVWDRDVMFELIHDTPNRCKILSINAEVN